MKGTIGAVILFAVIIACICISTNHMSIITGEITENIEGAIKACDEGDFDECERLIRVACSVWHDEQTYLSSIIPHSEMDDVSSTVAQCVGAAEQRLAGDFHIMAVKLKEQIERLAEMEELLIGNIL